jgi:tetratricopeptide (TPR) repeat protein
MKFLNQGQKIRKLRNELRLKQEDLISENITRPLISMIEVGKRNLTYAATNAIIEKFNKKAKELEINLDVDINYLLRSQSEDANIYCLEKLENNNIHDIFNELIQISDEFDLLEVKAKIYKKMGDSWFDECNYIESFVNYTNAIDIYKGINQDKAIAYIYWKIALCKANLLQYKEALSYFNLARDYAAVYNDIDINEISIYHIAKCYKKLNKIDLAKVHINNYLSICNKDKNFNYYVYANILRANCYEIEEQFDTVIEIYNCLIDEVSDSKSNLLGIIYNNLGLAYFYKDDLKTSVSYFEMAEKLRCEIDKANLSHTLIEKSIVFSKQGLYVEAIKTLELGLINAENYSDVEYLVKGNYMLADIYKILNDAQNLEMVYLRITDLLKNTNSIDIILIYNKLSSMYLDQNNITESKKYLSLSEYFIVKNSNLLYYSDI